MKTKKKIKKIVPETPENLENLIRQVRECFKNFPGKWYFHFSSRGNRKS